MRSRCGYKDRSREFSVRMRIIISSLPQGALIPVLKVFCGVISPFENITRQSMLEVSAVETWPDLGEDQSKFGSAMQGNLLIQKGEKSEVRT